MEKYEIYMYHKVFKKNTTSSSTMRELGNCCRVDFETVDINLQENRKLIYPYEYAEDSGGETNLKTNLI